MKLIERLFIIGLNFIIPFFGIMFIVIIQFFMYGEGASSEIMFQKYENLWLLLYISLGITQIIFLLKYLNFLKMYLKILFCTFICSLYIYYSLQF